MRFVFNVTFAADTWTIEVEGAGNKWTRSMTAHADGKNGGLPFPADKEPQAGLVAQTPAEVLQAYESIVRRDPKLIVEYGQYLFANLIGEKLWKEIIDSTVTHQENLIELALSWSPKDGNLTRLHWEMMHDGTQFLAAGQVLPGGQILDIAVTRVVPNSDGVPSQVSLAPRVLFVIGTSLSDTSIRPGAEIMGLLRSQEIEDRIAPMIVENASPRIVQEHIERFTPEVVHFICHGKFDAHTKAGYIEMRPDPDNDQKEFYAAQISQWLKKSTLPARIVVLSACDSGTTLGPHSVAPLAAELVLEGVAVVIAMSGRVSDLACRLFTRTLSEALLSGDTLVDATAKGRRAAIAEGEAPKRSVDWGFPVIFLSAKVPGNYAPGKKVAAVGAGTLQYRMKPYMLRRKPVFCGRTDFFTAFRDLLAPGSNNVLAIYVIGEPELKLDTKGYGRTRLLEELTLQAIREGHVPCAVLAKKGANKEWATPKEPLDLAMLIHEAMETARESLGLERLDGGPIVSLKLFDQSSDEKDLDPSLMNPLRLGHVGPLPLKVNPKAIAAAIRKQFAQLMADAQQAYPDLITKNSRAVLLLDDIHEYVDCFELITRESELGAYGFGSRERPVPVVISFAMSSPARDLLKTVTESTKLGWRPMELRRFERGHVRKEDMLAYANVLLNPYAEQLAPGVSDRAWVMDYEVDTNSIAKWEKYYREWLKGVPLEFHETTLFTITKFAIDLGNGFIVPATDRDYLKKIKTEGVANE